MTFGYRKTKPKNRAIRGLEITIQNRKDDDKIRAEAFQHTLSRANES